MRFLGVMCLISLLGLSACGRMRMADFGSPNVSVSIVGPGTSPSATPSPTPSPTPNPNFGLPAKKIEVLVGDDAPVFRTFDLSGAETGVEMAVTNTSTLPPGLAFNASNGTITGIPTVAGLYTVEVCFRVGGVVTNTCANVVYSILEETAIALTDQRPSTIPNGLCSSLAGIGSLADPIRITTASDLNTCVRNYPKAAFRLMLDIDIGATFPADTFAPLPFFYGNFDGNFHTISNWDWNIITSGVVWPAVGGTTNLHFNGLFRAIGMRAVVKNLTLNDLNLNTGLVDNTASPTYSSSNGFLAGFLRGGVVINVSVMNSTFQCSRACGGLVGNVVNPVISNPFPADVSSIDRNGYLNRVRVGTVNLNSNAEWSYLGGVVGQYNPPFRISQAQTTGLSMLSGNGVGGIAGSNLWGGATSASATDDSRMWLDRCSSLGSISDYSPTNDADFMGGLIGLMRGSETITDSYSRMTLTSSQNDTGQGGLVGSIEVGLRNEKHAIIAHSYFAGTLTGPNTGGVMGEILGGNFTSWSGPYTGANGLHLVRTKAKSSAFGVIGTNAAGINLVNNSTQVFTLQADWETAANFTGWLTSIWSFPLGIYPDHVPPP